MKRLRVFLLFTAAVTGCQTVTPSSPLGDAGDLWQVKKLDRPQRCTLVSRSIEFSTPYGVETVWVGIDHDGIVGLRTRQRPLSPEALDQISVRIDNHDPFTHPQLSPSGQIARFSSSASQQIIAQLKQGQFLRVQLVFRPGRQLSVRRLPLEGFANALIKHNMCKVISSSL